MSVRFLAWLCAALVLLAHFFVLRVIMPALINLHNDGALLFALLIPFGVVIGDYFFIKHLGPLMVCDNEE